MLVVGGKYPTKNGLTFEVQRDDSELFTVYQFFGVVTKPDGQLDRIAFYTAGGRYKESPCEYDLILN
nr:MAG TPA: hypothetical protein [Caudoviricetes sp.]